MTYQWTRRTALDRLLTRQGSKMKIIIGLLALILITLFFGSIAGIIFAVCIACLFIPGVGSIAASVVLFGGIAFVFGEQGMYISMLILPIVLLGLHFYSKQSLKEVAVKSPEPKVNIKSGTHHTQKTNAIFNTVAIQENNLVADNVGYSLSSIDLTWANDSLRIFYQGKVLGTSEKTRDEFKALNREISKQRKSQLA